MSKVYAFTNENIESFETLYKFSNSKVLSVLGSGDQYFAGLLYNAAQIDLYDINSDSWDYFLLKFFGLLILPYDNFFDFFINKQLKDIVTFNYLKKYLPKDTAKRLEEKIFKEKSTSSNFEFTDIAKIYYGDGHIIPYFNKEKYNQLKKILENTNLPKFYKINLKELPTKLNGEHYDIVLTSNIFYSLYLCNEKEKIVEYKELLSKFNCQEIQALYCWWLNPDFQLALENNNFEIQEVRTARDMKLTNDYVISLRKDSN